MSTAALLVVIAAMAIAASSAFFGVVLARFIWAQALKQAHEIDQARSKIEASLRQSIEVQAREIASLYRIIGAQQTNRPHFQDIENEDTL